MKRLMRVFLASLFGLWLTQKLIGGLTVADKPETFVLAGAALAFIYIFVRPILRLLFLPINLLSLGFLSWLTNVAVLYLLTVIVPEVKISNWTFPGLSYQGFIVPSFSFNQMGTFILVALALSLVMNFFNWLSQ